MSFSVTQDTITNAWLDDMVHLQAVGGDQLSLVTTITDPNPSRVNANVVDTVDRWLAQKRKQSVQTVANTIFPASLMGPGEDRQQLYDRYMAILPRLRKQSGNSHGTYFGRLVSYVPSGGDASTASINQLEHLILKIQKQLRAKNPKRFAYQAQLFVPGHDTNSTMGFPCLSYISFQLYKKELCLIAVYRNHFYFERALGNFIGLARLQEFVANATALGMGQLTVFACHAEIDALGKRDTRKLIDECQRANAVTTFSRC